MPDAYSYYEDLLKRAGENPENYDHRASDEFVGSDYRNGIYVGIQQEKIESLTNEKHFNCDGC